MENACPVVSVVIPTHNREDTLQSCLDSVLSQTFPPAEVLVVDDCSTDRTVEVATANADPRIRVLRLPSRSGAQAARNTGIRAAHGDWIAFLDSDDEWLPEKLGKQLKILAAANFDPLVMVQCSGIRIDDLTGIRTPIADVPVEGKDAYRKLLASPGPMFQGMLVSKQALYAIGLLDEAVRSFQEWDTSIRLAKLCDVVFVPEPLFIYHQHSGSAISKNITNAIEGFDYLLDKFRDEMVREYGDHVLRWHAVAQIRRCLQNGLWPQSKKYIASLPVSSLKRHIFTLFRLMKISPRPYYEMLSLVLQQTGKGK